MPRVDEEYRTLTKEELEEKADEMNCTLRVPKLNQLFVDIDSEEDYQQFCYLFSLLHDHYGYMKHEVTPSSSGLPHRHIVIELRYDIDEPTRILLQACLGSDRIRELLNFVDLTEYNAEITTAFFEPKPQIPVEF